MPPCLVALLFIAAIPTPLTLLFFLFEHFLAASIDDKSLSAAAAALAINKENESDLQSNQATKGLDYEAEITCANCSA